MTSAESTSALARQCEEQLRTGWQCRALMNARGKTAAVIMAVLFNEYADHMQVLLRVAFPGFTDVSFPALVGCASIARNGKVICEMFDRDRTRKIKVIYDSEDDLIGDMRKLADELKLDDKDRVAMTEAFKRWVVCDARVDHMGNRKPA